MALFDKLFSLKRRLDSDNFDPIDRRRSCQINPDQVRLLLFKECDWRGRRLLFDSSAIQKVPAGKHDKPSAPQDKVPCVVEVSDGFSYLYKGPEADATVLGEMIFGAVAMNYKSVSLKIHIMDEPRRLMCTKVFCAPAPRRVSRADRKASADASCGSARSTSMLKNASKPLNVPALKEDGVALSFSMDRGDSGFCGDQSPHSSVGSTFDYFSMFDTWDGSASHEDFYSFHSAPGRRLSAPSTGSWQRRTFQNIATRFDLRRSSDLLNVPTVTSCDSQIYSNSSGSGTSDSIASSSSLPQRKSKLGLAVLITVSDSAQLDLVRKCMEHSPQLQALVCRLRLATLSGGAGAGFVSTLHRAAADAARWLSDLIYGPRVQPTWLSMVTSEARVASRLADSLLSDLCSVLAVGDTKTSNFFISTLLTHVLTYHLGWVTTVSPYDTVDHLPPHTSTEARRPYNALWAQLGDLCGSIGFPPRAARTIISGEKNAPFVNRLLSILTYFLRCGDVKRTEFRYRECVLKETKTISANKPAGLNRTVTRVVKLDCDDLSEPSINTQYSDSASTLVASDASLKKMSSLSDLRHQLSIPECGGSSTGPKPTPLRRNPTMMLSSMKPSSDSSLNSSVSEDSVPEQKVVFVLGDDEKLVGLKNKSTNGKCVKKSSKVHNEPVDLETEKKECEGEGCDVRNTESPSKCCGQTLQHSKPIKHSGFKFEFDKYPQIVTNYMKSKNLEILDRHYIGKPGNLKLDNFQFDPMVVPPIQEEKCDSCVKCQMMESMLQTPTNASEMEYMNDIPRISEPQYAKEIVAADSERNHRELSPKTFVRRRKENVVVVNLIQNLKAAASNAVSETKVSISENELSQSINETDKMLVAEYKPMDTEALSIAPTETPKIAIEDANHLDSRDIADSAVEFRPLPRSNKLKFTKSTNNLQSLLSLEDSHSDDSSNELNLSNQRLLDTATSINESENAISLIKSKEIPSLYVGDSKFTSPNKSQIIRTNTTSATSSNDTSTSATSSNETSTSATSSNDTSTSATSSNDTSTSATSSNDTKSSLSDLTSTTSSSPTELKATSSTELQTSCNEAKCTLPPLLKPLELKRPEVWRVNQKRERDRTIEVKSVTEFSLPELCAQTESTANRSGFDRSLLGGVTDHYVPDLILQGTIARPCAWEPDLRRDLDVASYLNKQMDTAPVQAVAIIGDTNTWEVRVVGRDCGAGGMSPLVGAMLDALPVMCKAKVPAHQCLSFLESKLREFCVLSKTLADMLMSTDFCDVATLTKSLNIDANDVPLLLAVATTHTPQVATRYGISYR